MTLMTNEHLKSGRHPIVWVMLGLAILLLPHLAATAGQSWVRIIDLALLYVMLALGLNIVVGQAGLLDLGYVAFYAVGAYLYALLSSPHLANNFAWIAGLTGGGVHVPWFLVVMLAAGLAALAGITLGAPTLGLRGDYLAIVTLGFGEIIRLLMQNLDDPVNITNGIMGINNIAPLSLFGFNLGESHVIGGIEFTPLMSYYYVFVGFVMLSTLICSRLVDSRLGRAWMAIREDEIAAKAMGINTRNTKLLAFGLGASFGGVSGALFSSFQGFISPESFSLMESVMIVAMVVLGGMGHLPGVILGALLLAALPDALRYVSTDPVALLAKMHVLNQSGSLPDFVMWVADPTLTWVDGHLDSAIARQILIALAMILMMLLRPRGLWPVPEHGKALPQER